MRAVSTNFRTQAQAQQTGEAFLTLLELSYEGSDTIYLVNNYQNIVSNGTTYNAFPFNFVLPSDTETNRRASLIIDNIDRSIATFVLGAHNTNIEVVEKLVLSSTVDTIESTRNYILKNAVVTRKTVSGELSYMEYLQDAFPRLKKTPSRFPGIF